MAEVMATVDPVIEYDRDTKIIKIDGQGISLSMFQYFADPVNYGQMFNLVGKHEGGCGVDLQRGDVDFDTYHKVYALSHNFIRAISLRENWLVLQLLNLIMGDEAYIQFTKLYLGMWDVWRGKPVDKRDGEG